MSERPLVKNWSIRQEGDVAVVLTRQAGSTYAGPVCRREPLEAHLPRGGWSERLEIDEATLSALLEAARRIGQEEATRAAQVLWSDGAEALRQELRRYEEAA